MDTSLRLKGIDEYYFSQKLREIDAMNKSGKQVINLGIGSPDLPPHPNIIKILQEETCKSTQHSYQSYKGSPVFRNAIAQWYNKWYGILLDPDTEILPLMGSKEGIMHICMTYLNKGDKVLIPNPGYPTYKNAVQLAGGTPVEYMLSKKGQWFPDILSIENTVDVSKVKLMFLNYPHMPSGQLPTQQFFKSVIHFAKENNILLIHDNPYSFILNKKPLSLLSMPGAMKVAIELNSLSKSHNMAGWRIGMMIGAKARIDEVLRFKSNMDSGMFLPIQLAAAKALQLDKQWFNQLNIQYAKRRKKLFTLLTLLGCSFDKQQAGLFVWAAIPDKAADGYSLSDFILKTCNIFITPGGIFGSAGNNYIRISLCSSEEKIEEAIKRISDWKKSNGNKIFL